jgi:ribose transport system permease protein
MTRLQSSDEQGIVLDAARRPRAAAAQSVLSVMKRAGTVHDLPLMLVLVLMIGVVSSFHPEYLSSASLVNLTRNASYFGTMAFGMVFLLSMREIDLSVGAIYGLSILVAAKTMEHGLNPWIAAALSLVAGVLLGMINGLIANLLKVQTIIVTLGTLSMYSALALILAGDTTVTDLPTSSSFFTSYGGGWHGVPISVWMAIVVGVCLQVVYRYTRFGYRVRAIGSNPEAARLAGISIARTRLVALMLQGFICALIGTATLAYIEAADPNTGQGYELSVIAAAIIGGTALSGGSGSIPGAMIGALIISTVSTGLIQFGVSADWGDFATGVVIVAAVALDLWLKRRRAQVAEGAGRRAILSSVRRASGTTNPTTGLQGGMFSETANE